MFMVVSISMFGCSKLNYEECNKDCLGETELELEQYNDFIEYQEIISENQINIEEETIEIETISNIEIELETTEAESETTESELETFNIEELNKVMYAKSYVNVRNYPSAVGAKVGCLKLAQPVRVLGLTSLGWYLVEYNGENCYVSGNYLLDEEPKQEVVLETTNNSLADSQLESMITFHDGVSHETQVAAYQYWSMIPEQTRARIHNNGWKIEVVNSRYLDDYYDGVSSVVGITYWGENKILMGNSVKHMRRALNHEIGHAIDYMYDWTSYSSEWYSIWEEERLKMEIQEKFDDHPIENTTEFFAECVQQYIQYNDILSRTCPRAYEYISRYVY